MLSVLTTHLYTKTKRKDKKTSGGDGYYHDCDGIMNVYVSLN